ncbi:6-phospho-3-hexuloisomerase [Methanolacinia petrolearia]|uniref:6-phospho-3-hexuloisomerase n=1 Tax=Methanolacinia petrolearia TaxID=54120 RepID=UPI003BA95A9D
MSGCGDVKMIMRTMTDEISRRIEEISDDEISSFTSSILTARRIYVAGAGRSGLIARAFAMRLMHIGLESYVVGETVTPAMEPGDAGVVFSGTGETNSMVDIAESTKALGGTLCLITSHRGSSIGKLADYIVEIPLEPPEDREWPNTFEVRQLTGGYKSLFQPLAAIGTFFETAAMIFSDALIADLMDIRKCGIEEVMKRLSNIQ